MVLMLRSSEAEWQEYIWRKTTSTPVGLLLIVMLLIHLEATGSSKARRRAWTDSAVFVGSCCVWIDFPAHCTSSQGKRTKISESIYSVNVEAWILKNCSVIFFFNYLCGWFQGKVFLLLSSRNVYKKVSCCTFFTNNFFGNFLSLTCTPLPALFSSETEAPVPSCKIRASLWSMRVIWHESSVGQLAYCGH